MTKLRYVGLGLLAWCIASTVTTSALAITYEYDDLGRLKKATYDNGAVVEYTYDPAGNRTQHVVSGAGLSPPPLAGVVVLPIAGFVVIPLSY